MTLTAMQKYKTYKWSGNPFFGDIPSCWDIFPLLRIAKIKSIINKQDEELLSVYLDRGVIKFSDVDEKRTNVTSLDLSKYQFVEKGDFVLNNQQAWRGSVGVSEYIGIVSPAYLVLSLSKEINPKYANYLFRDGSMVSQYLICSKGVGTIQRNLYWPHLRRTVIALPPYNEQTAIANFLDKKTNQIDEAIAIKEQQILLLNERKQILIQQVVTQGLDPTVPMKDSGVEWIGKIPEHWDIIKLKNIIKTLESGVSVNASESESATSSDIGVLKTSAVYRFKFDPLENKKVFASDIKRVACPVKAGSIIISRMNAPDLVGASGYVYHDYPNLYLPDRLWQARFDSAEELYAAFISHVLITKGVRTVIESIATGSSPSMKNISKGDFLSIKIAKPPVNELKEITENIDSINAITEKMVIHYTQQIQKLKEYKTTLINSAVTGKIKVV
ncbi:restriction endonuclease subunit S [Aeromonas caviae]|uniref:restriction endonuclease subunit S n=1 Tax=Aeromonas caviae TaxID=648 RepID=UPI002B45EB85|nr:restriction endonuclease subunit S [Aeromonas caviae]